MEVGEILKSKETPVITVREEDTLETAATVLASNNIGATPVRNKEGALVGILSERDIVRGLARKGGQAHCLLVSDVMTANLLTIDPDTTVKSAMETMDNQRFRHLPVLKDGELIGMISLGDVMHLRLEESELEKNVLRDVVISRS